MIHQPIRQFVFASLAVLLFALPAIAMTEPVVLVADDRGGYRQGQPCSEDWETGEYSCGSYYNQSYSPPTDFVDWNGGGQNTKVSPLAMSGTGSGSAFSDYGWNESNTTFDITFDVLTPVTFDMTGSMWAGSYWGGGEAFAWLDKGAERIFSVSAYDNEVDLLFSTVLLPGRYRINIHTATYPIADAWFDFSVVMAPTTVPEPSTALLVGLGLVLAGRRNRQQTSHQSMRRRLRDDHCRSMDENRD